MSTDVITEAFPISTTLPLNLFKPLIEHRLKAFHSLRCHRWKRSSLEDKQHSIKRRPWRLSPLWSYQGPRLLVGWDTWDSTFPPRYGTSHMFEPPVEELSPRLPKHRSHAYNFRLAHEYKRWFCKTRSQRPHHYKSSKWSPPLIF